MSAKTWPLLFLAILLSINGCAGKWVNPGGKIAEPKPLSDAAATAVLNEWAQSLGGIEKSFRGEVAYVRVIQPVILLSQMRRAEVEAAGFGQKAPDKGRGYNIQYRFETPLDKCNWLAHLIGYPLSFKLDVAPGIRLALSGTGLSYDEVGAPVHGYLPYPPVNIKGYNHGMANTASGLTVDDINTWKSNLDTPPQIPRNLPEGVSPLYIAIAIEVPGGDAWFDDMDTSFRATDAFTFHIKAFRESQPENVAYGAAAVKYEDIFPFLTELAAKVASVQGFYELSPEQIGWLSQEPVMNIRAWGDFLVAYSKRTWEYVDVMPAHTKSGEYLERIYDALDKADPGNTLSLMHKSQSEQGKMKDFAKPWEGATEHKPYLPLVYENLAEAKTAQATKGQGDYDPFPLWEKAVTARPDVAKFHMYYAGVLLKRGEFDKAVAEYRTSQRIEPGMWLNCWHTWGFKYGKFGREANLDDEMKFAEMIVGEYPDDQESRQCLANLYINKGDYGKAREQYDFNKDLDIGNYLVKGYIAKGMTAEAIEVYEDMVKARPDYVSNWKDLADLYKSKGDEANELRALEGFLANVDRGNTGYADDISKSRGRIAALKGDTSGQIRNLLANYPSYVAADPLYIDLAEAIHKDGYTADALYLTYIVLGDLSFQRDRLIPKQKVVLERAMELKGKLIKEFWPEYDASKMLPSNAYPSPYTELRDKKKVVGIREIIPEYRKMLNEHPSIIEVNQYVLMVEQVYKNDLEAVLEAKLLQAIITDATQPLDNWDAYEKHLKEKLEGKYGKAENAGDD